MTGASLFQKNAAINSIDAEKYPLNTSGAERNIYPAVKSYLDNRSCLMFKPRADSGYGNTRCISGGLYSDPPTGFYMRDQAGRVLVPRVNNPANRGQDRHPTVVKQVIDPLTDTVLLNRASLMLGMSPTSWDSTYRLAYSTAGTCLPHWKTDEGIFFPNLGGWVFVTEFLIMPPSSSVKIVYPDDTNETFAVTYTGTFSLLGARAIRNGTGKAFQIYIDSSGKLVMSNRAGTNMWVAGSYAKDWRDGAKHLLIVRCDMNAGTVYLYEWNYNTNQEDELAHITGVSVDIANDSVDNSKLRMWAVGYPGDGNSIFNTGMFATVNCWFPGPAMAVDADARDLIWDWAKETG